MEMYRPKSRTELYKEKLKERELYSNNVLDRFTENGGGAPLRNKDGSIITKRRTMLNNDYEDIYLNQRNRTPISYNYNQQINSLQEMNSNMSNTINNNIYGMNELNNNNNNNNNYNNNFYQTLPIGIIDNNVYNMKNINDTENENNAINNDIKINNNMNNNTNDYQNQRQTFERRPRSQINYNNNDNNNNILNNQFNNTNNNYRQRNEGRDYDHYEGTGVILKDENIEENNRRKYRNLREEWLKEIEDKKEREAQRKRKEREEEFKLEEKYRREQEEEKEKERLEKLRLNENLRNISNTNLMMMENNKKKKNALEMEDLNNINNNYNNMTNYNIQEGMAMNGNNLEPNQINIQENKMINENETASQNFGIIRDQNTMDINNNQINDMELYSNNPQDLEDNINMQIAKLRDDVNSQYIEMSNLFGKLKMDVIEATQLKNEAEKELQYIRKELAKNKMASLAYDAELNQVLEKHAPYNNLHINIKDVDPMYSLRNVRKDIQTTSNMIYNTDMINEQNVNRVKQLSALAQAGQNLVGLKAESEFIPINGPNENNNNEYNNEINNNIMENDPKNNIAVSKTGYKNLDNESYPIYQQENINNKENEFNNEPKILDDYMNKGEYSDMYKQLVDIANINHEMGAENKLKTLNKNYDVDFNNFNQKHSEQQKKIINNFDQLLNEIN